jgi:hypothetical protein
MAGAEGLRGLRLQASERHVQNTVTKIERIYLINNGHWEGIRRKDN